MSEKRIEIENIIVDMLCGRVKIEIEENLNKEKYNTLIRVEQNVFGTIAIYRLYVNELADIEEIEKSIRKQLYNDIIGTFFNTKNSRRKGVKI